MTNSVEQLFPDMTIYFAGSIRGGRSDVALYAALITHLKRHGRVWTEHIGDANVTDEEDLDDVSIHNQDVGWLLQSDAVVAEVTVTSLGVGYEIGRAVAAGIPVLCLYRPAEERRLSAMIAGCNEVTTVYYNHLDEACKEIDHFLHHP